MYYPQMNYQQPLYGQTNNLIRVNGIEGAKAYQMSPNGTVVLFDDNNDIFYLKTSDGAGFASIREFAFTEKKTPAESRTDDFMTKTEFETEIKKIREEIKNYGEQYIQQSESTKSKSNKS